MKKIKLLAGFTLTIFMLANSARAQNVGIGTLTPNVSARLDITATNKGLLIPRVALAGLTDIVTIATPANGLLVYNTNEGLPEGTGFYYNSGGPGAALWVKFQTASGGGSGWLLSGNAGTDPTLNFLGTTDDQPITFKVNNGYAGMLGSGGLIAIGRGSAAIEMTNTPGIIAIGDSTLFNNTQDSSEIAIGNNALFSNSTPGDGDNVAIGHFSMVSSTGGFQNTALGWGTLAFNDTGFQCVAIGYRAALGTGGEQTTAVGAFALENDQIGFNNTAIGFATLNSNGNGFYNVAVGSEALLSNFLGNRNTAVGRASLASDSSGIRNTGYGYFSAANLFTGNKNVAIGSYAMRTNTAGNNNICIGDSADVVSGATILNNAIAIGTSSIVNASNKVMVGNTSHTSIGGQVGWTTFSDGRYKKDVTENVSGLSFIMKLRPVTYQYDFDKIDNELYHRGFANTTGLIRPFTPASHNTFKGSGKLVPSNGKRSNAISVTDDAARRGSNATPGFANPNEGVRFTGFIAQEVEEAAKKTGFDFSGVDKPTTPGANYGLRYAEFVVPLVKAVQEQQAIIDAQNKKIEDLTNRLEKLEKN